MPPLPNARHERFAQAISRGLTVDAAYQEAGYRANSGNAARLNGDERIRNRTAELLSRNVQKADKEYAVSLADLHRELDVAFEIAVREGDARAIVMITQTRAKLGGLWVDKSESTTRVLDPTQMKTRDQDTALVEFMLKGRLSEQQLGELMNGRMPALPPTIKQ
jgi:hypothetical protein